MKEPLTDELLAELLQADSPVKFADERELGKPNLAACLCQLVEEKGLVRADVINESGINYTYAYELFTGKKDNPSRNYVLQLAFAMRCTLDETNRLLKKAGHRDLYCKDRRDAIIIYCVEHEASLREVEEALYRFGEKTLSKSN